MPAGAAPDRLDLLKALGDNTRYAIYLELARSPRPRSTAEVAETLGLHPNTVRPHLERMREVGLLQVEAEGRGAIGRPHHRYSLAPDAPGLGLEPPAMPLLARLLVEVAASAGAGPEEAAEIGRSQGRDAAERLGAGPATAPTGPDDPDDDDAASRCIAALVAELDHLGYDPALATDDSGVTVAFAHCPFADLAESHPEIVCHIHRGLVEGFVAALGGAEVTRFGTLVDRTPCRVELVAG
ncbi:MAG: helix-turn-helix transcriptional regulator [Acidimicrobiia bacterium]